MINWAVHVEQFGLKEGKELFGNRAVIGGFAQTKESILYKGTKEEIENALQKVNYNNIRFEENNVILDGNIQLDLGAIGKGYACDRVLNYLKKQDY